MKLLAVLVAVIIIIVLSLSLSSMVMHIKTHYDIFQVLVIAEIKKSGPANVFSIFYHQDQVQTINPD